jgi:hypothetical protein
MMAGFAARRACRGILPRSVVLALLLGAGEVRAQPSFTVERAAGAESCPNAESLVARIEAIRRKSAPGRADYRVTFSLAGEEFAASITAGSPGQRRTILSRRPTCVALGEATAVTLALLFDSDALEEEHPLESAPPPMAPAVTVAGPPPGLRGASLSVGAAGLVGALSPFSLAGIAEADGAIGRWRAGIGALWALPETQTLGPGDVREEMLSGLARVCYAPLQRGKLRMDLCSGAYVGAMTGDASGFSTESQRTRLWVALPAELVLAYTPVRHLGWELSAGALWQLHRNDFGIDGLGVAYRSPVVAGLVSLRAVALLSW